MKNYILNMCDELEPSIKSIKQYLHKNPELSLKEHETKKYLQSLLKDLDLKFIQTGKTPGFLAILDTKKQGKTIALRTDIDALPIVEEENNLKQKRHDTSLNDGIMHACGHDGHMSMMVGIIRILCSLKDDFSGKVIFCFESAEENGGGWEDILEMLSEFHVDAMYATHVYSNMESGFFSADAGPVMGGCINLAFEVLGRGGHGSRPDLAINPVFPMAAILNNFSIAYSNYKYVDKILTLGITRLEASKAINVIADKGYMAGTLRYFDRVEAERFYKKLKEITIATAKMHGCGIKFITDYIGEPVINDKELSLLLQDSISDLYPNCLQKDIKWYASESFAKYAKIAPVCLMFLGIKNDIKGTGAEHHNAFFDLDEDVLKRGIAAMSYCAFRFLKGE